MEQLQSKSVYRNAIITYYIQVNLIYNDACFNSFGAPEKYLVRLYNGKIYIKLITEKRETLLLKGVRDYFKIQSTCLCIYINIVIIYYAR